MRLTLRTLLAYLDDTLEPNQAKVIGQKIAESPAAQELMARIKKVVRQRRLTVPPATGPAAKLDPNTIAEYIDSVLPPEQLGEVEEACLESDLYLAEVAACHQILTVVLSEPAPVPPPARQRMYGIAKGPEAIPYRRAARDSGTDLPAHHGGDRDEADETLLLGLPFFTGKGPWYRRLAPVGLLLLLGVGIILAIYKAIPPGPTNGPRPEGLVARNDVKETPARTEKEPAPAPTPAKPEPGKGDRPSAAKPPEGAGTKAPADSGEAAVGKPTPKPGANVAGENSVAPAGCPPRNTDTPKREPKGERKAIGRYHAPASADPSVLLTRANDQPAWQRLYQGQPVFSEDRLVSLPGYRSSVVVNGLDVVLWGDLPEDPLRVLILESAATLHASPDADLDMTVDYGRVAVTNTRPAARATVRFRVHDQSWVLNLEPGGRAAVDVFGAPGLDFTREADKQNAPLAAFFLHVLKGQADLRFGSTQRLMREPPGPALFVWDNIIGPQGPQNLERLPPWADGTPRWARNREMVKALAELSKRLGPRDTVDIVLTEMLRDPSPNRKILATYCLGALGDLDGLLEAMSNEAEGGTRVAATVVLQHWLGQGGNHDQQLYRLLEKKYKSATTAENIMHLLHDFSETKRRHPETYEWLIWRLKDDKLIVRHLAYLRLLRMDETKPIAQAIPYDPAGGTEQREQAYDAWKAVVPDGKLPPKNFEPKGNGKKPATGPRK